MPPPPKQGHVGSGGERPKIDMYYEQLHKLFGQIREEASAEHLHVDPPAIPFVDLAEDDTDDDDDEDEDVSMGVEVSKCEARAAAVDKVDEEAKRPEEGSAKKDIQDYTAAGSTAADMSARAKASSVALAAAREIAHAAGAAGVPIPLQPEAGPARPGTATPRTDDHIKKERDRTRSASRGRNRSGKGATAAE